MTATNLTWKDQGQHRGVTITAGSAYVGILVQLLLDSCVTEIRVDAIEVRPPRAEA